ncbi:MAG: hypothetical protein ACQERL_05240 [Bacillota bacterium]
MKKINFTFMITLILILFFNTVVLAVPEIDIFDRWIASKNQDTETGNISVTIYQADYAIPLRIKWKDGERTITMQPYKIEDLGNEHQIYYQFDDGVSNRVVCKIDQEKRRLYIPNSLEKELITKMMTHEKLNIGSFELPDPTAGNTLSYDLNRFDEAIKKYNNLFLTD